MVGRQNLSVNIINLSILTTFFLILPRQSLRVSNGLPAIGHPNFAPDKSASSLIETQTGGGGGGGAVGGGGFQKKPLVIDMAKIREKFNILGDRGGAVATQQRPLRRLVSTSTCHICYFLGSKLESWESENL